MPIRLGHSLEWHNERIKFKHPEDAVTDKFICKLWEDSLGNSYDLYYVAASDTLVFRWGCQSWETASYRGAGGRDGIRSSLFRMTQEVMRAAGVDLPNQTREVV